MAKQIEQSWYRVLVALMNDKTIEADRERARLEGMRRVHHATTRARLAVKQVAR